ncbi:hypothetical protein DH2020_007137 [Rehmannia glutinosa]|uniref:Protein PIR n=1 Tax=Rehmannia glutinosa TaxID=99300 RepID=A0ABR0TXA9_REHGL
MLVDHVVESQNAGLLESVLMPFDIYNDAAQQALVVLKKRFLYDEIEAELLGRTINLRSLITERINKVCRENIEFLFDRFESQDLCAIVELEKLLEVLQLAHELLSKDLTLDSFSLMLNEMQENVSLVSYSSRLASQIWTEMQNDFLPNFILCNTTQRFVRSSRVPTFPVQKPSVPHAKPNFYCDNNPRTIDHWTARGFAQIYRITSFDGGVAGCIRIVQEHLNCWQSKSEMKIDALRGIKEIGSVLYWMSLLDIVLREVDTSQFMQTAPWLGLTPGVDGQIIQFQDSGDSPIIISLFKSLAAASTSNPSFSNPSSLRVLSRQAEAADLLYKSNINAGSVLEYSLAFTSAALDKYCSKWSVIPKTGFLDITTSKDFYRIYSGLQMEYLEEAVQVQPSHHGMLGDSVAWGGCTIIYLLGQQLHFELFDFSHQVLNVAEVEVAGITPAHKNSHSLQGLESLLEAMKKARRLNNHVFSMLKARCPLEDKQACAIKQSGAPLHRIKFENTVSAFETLPQKGA